MKPPVAVLPLISLFLFSGLEQPASQSTAASANATTPRTRWIVTVGGKRGYIDRTGKVVIKPQWDTAYKFSEGLATVCVGNCDQEHLQGYRLTKDFTVEPVEQTFKFGYIDEDGKMVINPMFEEAGDFSEGLAAVCQGHRCYSSTSEQKWGYIDKSGKMVITPQFEYGRAFHEGLAGVSVGGKYGFIDKTGRFVIDPQYDSVMYFENGIAEVWIDYTEGAEKRSKSGYIDKEGKTIWAPSN